jgi:hypothetical protein
VLSGHEVREWFLERFGSNTLSFLAPFLSGHWEQAGEFRDYLTSVAGLIVGGVVAAPLAGWTIKALQRPLLRFAGFLITLLAGADARTNWSALNSASAMSDLQACETFMIRPKKDRSGSRLSLGLSGMVCKGWNLADQAAAKRLP